MLRAGGREMLGEGFLEIRRARNPRFAFLVIGARLNIQMTLARRGFSVAKFKVGQLRLGRALV